jgi:branched-chain amino acid transport system permease protein
MLGWPLELAVVAGVVVAAGLGFGLERFIYRPLRARKASSMVLLIASLGAFTVLQALLAIAFTSQFQTLSGLVLKTVVHVAGGAITGVQLVTLGAAIAVLVGARTLLSRTRFGKAVRAISDDEEVARVVGINTNRMIGRVFLLCSGVAGLTGILVGMDTGLEPTMGLQLLLKGVIAAIIGGVGNVYGAFLGAFLLAAVENFGVWQISSEWKDALAFGVLIVFLLVRPQGILGAKAARA